MCSYRKRRTVHIQLCGYQIQKHKKIILSLALILCLFTTYWNTILSTKVRTIPSSHLIKNLEVDKKCDEKTVSNSSHTFNDYGILEIDYISIQEFLNELNQRSTKIKEECANDRNKLKKTSPYQKYTDLYIRLYIDIQHNITWCPIFKAASTTMVEVFAKLTGIWRDGMEHKIQNAFLTLNEMVKTALFNNTQTNVEEVVSSSIRMIVVRHPFERLLSAYRDKLEHKENRRYYYEMYGKKIVKQFGHPQQDVPTFAQFLEFLANGNYYVDEHWRPFYRQCAPCWFAYHYILKTETFDEEINMLFTVLELQKFLPSTKLNENKNGQTNIEAAKKYFSSVPRILLKKIYKIYQKDFTLFNYSPDMYFNMTQYQIHNKH